MLGLYASRTKAHLFSQGSHKSVDLQIMHARAVESSCLIRHIRKNAIYPPKVQRQSQQLWTSPFNSHRQLLKRATMINKITVRSLAHPTT